jgi:hypothetical protein
MSMRVKTVASSERLVFGIPDVVFTALEADHER